MVWISITENARDQYESELRETLMENMLSKIYIPKDHTQHAVDF